MNLETKRDRTKPFTFEELEKIESAAKADGNELVEELACVLLDIEQLFDKRRDVDLALLSKVDGFMEVMKFGLPNDGSVPDLVFKNMREFVDGMKNGEVDPKESEDVWQHGTTFTFRSKTNWASEVIAASIARSLRKPDGSYWNNITYEMSYLGETFYVEVQRKSGKTVKQQLNEACEHIRLLTEEIQKLITEKKAQRQDG